MAGERPNGISGVAPRPLLALPPSAGRLLARDLRCEDPGRIAVEPRIIGRWREIRNC